MRIPSPSPALAALARRTPRRRILPAPPAPLPRSGLRFFSSTRALWRAQPPDEAPPSSEASPHKRPATAGPVDPKAETASAAAEPDPTLPAAQKRKASRAAAAAKKSLRRVAIIAQQPKRGANGRPSSDSVPANRSSMISAVCVAESFDMSAVVDILSSSRFSLDPDAAGFDATEVVHARGPGGKGDIFVFPSGTLVCWSVAPQAVTKLLLPAAEEPHAENLREVEDLDFVADTARAESTMRGDLVVLGTRGEDGDGDRLDTTLAKIAFSSGLARSTKLAVLESGLTAYFESTRNIPALLSRGSGLPLSRRFILQKTGELLSLRARLNHYSELTDSLPDLFWDSRAELGLEGYYDQVGRALDVNVRIRTLNQKMDYAQEIASVLREMSSEQHGTRLEIIIILLIAVEVVFELRRIVLEKAPEPAAGPEPAS